MARLEDITAGANIVGIAGDAAVVLHHEADTMPLYDDYDDDDMPSAELEDTEESIACFLEAFQSLGGRIKPREKGRYEIASVLFAVRSRDMQTGFKEEETAWERAVEEKYGDLCRCSLEAVGDCETREAPI